jgi:hypothetical protein
MSSRVMWIAPVLVTVACASAPRPSHAQTPPQATDTSKAIPVGLGTLKQDAFTMGLRSGSLLVKITPLDEAVIRLAAPDTYNRLRALRASREKEAVARTASDNAELFLVSFFSYEPDATFQPEDVQLEYQGRLMRASAIMSLTPNWGKGRLAQQEIATAVYVFSDAMNFDQPLIVRYGTDENNEWQSIIPRLQVERGKITGRARN